MNTTQYTKIQVPLKTSTKKKAENIADEYGYSSLQEVVRIFLTSFSKGKIQPSFFTNDTVEYISPEYEAYLDKRVEEINKAMEKGEVYTIHSAEELDNLLDEVD